MQTLKRQADPGITIILVANKIDLCADAPERRRVSREDAERYAADEGLLYAEASAKTGEGVQEIFVQVGEWAVSGRQRQRSGTDKTGPDMQPRSSPCVRRMRSMPGRTQRAGSAGSSWAAMRRARAMRAIAEWDGGWQGPTPFV